MSNNQKSTDSKKTFGFISLALGAVLLIIAFVRESSFASKMNRVFGSGEDVLLLLLFGGSIVLIIVGLIFIFKKSK